MATQPPPSPPPPPPVSPIDERAMAARRHLTIAAMALAEALRYLDKLDAATERDAETLRKLRQMLSIIGVSLNELSALL